MPEKRGPGRPKQYETVGAPKLTVRVDPDVYERVIGRPEGPRAYIERVVRADMGEDCPIIGQGVPKTEGGEMLGQLPLSGEAELAAEA